MPITKPQGNEDLRRIANGFRQTRAGIQLGKMLFDPSQLGKLTANPTQITKLLQAAGLKIPSEVHIGVDTAQIIVSGGAFLTAIEAGASIGQIARPGLNAAQAALGIMELAGLWDSNSVAGQIVAIGVDVLMILASMGTNLYAWASLIIDTVKAAFFPPDERPYMQYVLESGARAQVMWWLQNRLSHENEVKNRLVKEYTNKEISIFEFIGNFAIEAGWLFPNYFPEYKVFIPPVTTTWCETRRGSAKHGGFLGIGRQTDEMQATFCYSFDEVKANRSLMQQVFVRKYINDPFAPYLAIEAISESQLARSGYPKNKPKPKTKPVYPRIPVEDLALLCVMSGSPTLITDNFKLSKLLQRVQLTPSDLGLTDIIQMNAASDSQYLRQENFKEAGLTINGIGHYTASQKAYNKSIALDNYTAKAAIDADTSGNIDRLVGIPQARAIVDEWGFLPYMPQELIDSQPAIYKVADPSLQVQYRDVMNLFSVYSVMDFLMKDPFFSDGQYWFDYVKHLLGTKEQMEAKYSEWFWLTTAKYTNAQAKRNIASFFNTTPDKLEYKIQGNGLGYVVPKKK